MVPFEPRRPPHSVPPAGYNPWAILPPPTAHYPSQATGYHVTATLEHPAGQHMWQADGNDRPPILQPLAGQYLWAADDHPMSMPPAPMVAFGPRRPPHSVLPAGYNPWTALQPPPAQYQSQAAGYHPTPTLEHPAGQYMWQGAGSDPPPILQLPGQYLLAAGENPMPMQGPSAAPHPRQPARYDPMPMPGLPAGQDPTAVLQPPAVPRPTTLGGTRRRTGPAINYDDGASASRAEGCRSSYWGRDMSQRTWIRRNGEFRLRLRPKLALEPIILHWPESPDELGHKGERRETDEWTQAGSAADATKWRHDLYQEGWMDYTHDDLDEDGP
ncbi:MAG: hypothetical protein M1826_002554 [Phylliscum demangeonii]|nr:MAG: hypothetical protein M1826_002554 [Phylliscum demangeonii]